MFLRLLCIDCAGHFVVDESNQDPYESGTLMLGTLNPGNLESQSPGNLVFLSLGTLGICNLAILETLQLWNLGTLQVFWLQDSMDQGTHIVRVLKFKVSGKA